MMMMLEPRIRLKPFTIQYDDDDDDGVIGISRGTSQEVQVATTQEVQVVKVATTTLAEEANRAMS
jgi:hypothetical protein